MDTQVFAGGRERFGSRWSDRPSSLSHLASSVRPKHARLDRGLGIEMIVQ
jgi:hypothetical protein